MPLAGGEEDHHVGDLGGLGDAAQWDRRTVAVYIFWLYSATCPSSAVSVGPGQTLFTVMPCRATSRASALPKAMIPPFVAEYTTSPG
ncbi:hypothetical protein SALBM311S_01686 [Streptomyces alboniger]